MKHRSTWATVAAAALPLAVLSAGCGGGSDGATNTTLPGIWTGTYTSTAQAKAVASPSRLVIPSSVVIQFLQTGTTITGTAEVSTAGQVGFGTISGSANGSTITAIINYTQTEMVTSTVSITGNTLAGNYVRTLNGTTVDSGTVSLTKSNITSTANIAATYTGTSLQDAAGSTSKPLHFTVVQTGNTISLNGAGGSAFTGVGAVIGTKMEAHLAITGSTDTIDLVGTVNGSSITGTTYEPGTDSGNNGVVQTGTFTVASGT